MIIEQQAFDLDAMLTEVNPAPSRPPYRGRAPLHFTMSYFTIAELEAAHEEARLMAADDWQSRPRHMWGPSFSNPAMKLDEHGLTILSADLRCDCFLMPPYGYDAPRCFCAGDLVAQAICEPCAWHSIGHEAAVVTEWHDHAMPGWRELPVVPEGMSVFGDNMKPTKSFTKWIADAYPEEWKRPFAPIITYRERPVNRHVAGRSPWGGYDIATSGMGAAA